MTNVQKGEGKGAAAAVVLEKHSGAVQAIGPAFVQSSLPHTQCTLWDSGTSEATTSVIGSRTCDVEWPGIMGIY